MVIITTMKGLYKGTSMYWTVDMLAIQREYRLTNSLKDPNSSNQGYPIIRNLPQDGHSKHKKKKDSTLTCVLTLVYHEEGMTKL